MQLERLVARDNGRASKKPARFLRRKRIARTRLQAADDVLVNSGTVYDLHQAVDRLHKRYLELAAATPPLKMSSA